MWMCYPVWMDALLSSSRCRPDDQLKSLNLCSWEPFSRSGGTCLELFKKVDVKKAPFSLWFLFMHPHMQEFLLNEKDISSGQRLTDISYIFPFVALLSEWYKLCPFCHFHFSGCNLCMYWTQRSRETTGNKGNWDSRWGCFHGCQLKALNHQSTPSLSFLYWLRDLVTSHDSQLCSTSTYLLRRGLVRQNNWPVTVAFFFFFFFFGKDTELHKCAQHSMNSVEMKAKKNFQVAHHLNIAPFVWNNCYLCVCSSNTYGNYTAQVSFISVSHLTHWMQPFLWRISANTELIFAVEPLSCHCEPEVKGCQKWEHGGVSAQRSKLYPHFFCDRYFNL